MDKSVKIIWNQSNRKQYEEAGYQFSKYGDEFDLKIRDIAHGSDTKIPYICDYCGEVNYKSAYHYFDDMKRGKVACRKCMPLKCRESCLEKYGVPHHNQVPELAEKIASKRRLPKETIVKLFVNNDLQIIDELTIKNTTRPIQCICNKHTKKGILRISYSNLRAGKGCRWCGIDKKSGPNSCKWKGGITSLSSHLRKATEQWRKDSMKSCNYKCVITGEEHTWEIHHLYPMNKIIQEVLDELNLPLKNSISEYTNKELEKMSELCLTLHYKYGLGKCIRKDLHEQFHNIYGHNDTTPEQFYEFLGGK